MCKNYCKHVTQLLSFKYKHILFAPHFESRFFPIKNILYLLNGWGNFPQTKLIVHKKYLLSKTYRWNKLGTFILNKNCIKSERKLQ